MQLIEQKDSQEYKSLWEIFKNLALYTLSPINLC